MKASTKYRKDSRKYWKARAIEQMRIADDLFTQLQGRAGELQEIDLALRDAEFPGPSLPEWADQLATFFLELAHKRGVTPRPFPGAALAVDSSPRSTPKSSTPAPLSGSGWGWGEAADNGEHELVTVDDVTARS